MQFDKVEIKKKTMTEEERKMEEFDAYQKKIKKMHELELQK